MIHYLDALLDYMESSSAITIFVLSILLVCFIICMFLFFYKYPSLSSIKSSERKFLEVLSMGGNAGGLGQKSALQRCMQTRKHPSRELLNVCKNDTMRETTSGLTLLAVIASTSPFIGLFGTVVSILESFAALGSETKATFNMIAPVISEALIATAAGIFVAIPAYSFHLMLKRKAFEIISIIDTQIEIIVSKESRSIAVHEDSGTLNDAV